MCRESEGDACLQEAPLYSSSEELFFLPYGIHSNTEVDNVQQRIAILQLIAGVGYYVVSYELKCEL